MKEKIVQINKNIIDIELIKYLLNLFNKNNYIYKSHNINKNIINLNLISEYGRYSDFYNNVIIDDDFIISRNQITVYEHKILNLNDYKNCLNSYKNINKALLNFIHYENIKDIKIIIEHKYNIENIDEINEIYKNKNILYNKLVNENSDIFILICLNKLFTYFDYNDLFDKYFILKDCRQLLTFINNNITLEYLIKTINEENYKPKKTSYDKITIFNNDIMEIHNDFLFNTFEVFLMRKLKDILITKETIT